MGFGVSAEVKVDLRVVGFNDVVIVGLRVSRGSTPRFAKNSNALFNPHKCSDLLKLLT